MQLKEKFEGSSFDDTALSIRNQPTKFRRKVSWEFAQSFAFIFQFWNKLFYSFMILHFNLFLPLFLLQFSVVIVLFSVFVFCFTVVNSLFLFFYIHILIVCFFLICFTFTNSLFLFVCSWLCFVFFLTFFLSWKGVFVFCVKRKKIWTK